MSRDYGYIYFGSKISNVGSFISDEQLHSNDEERISFDNGDDMNSRLSVRSSDDAYFLQGLMFLKGSSNY